jgi:hypothetical protein
MSGSIDSTIDSKNISVSRKAACLHFRYSLEFSAVMGLAGIEISSGNGSSLGDLLVASQ